MCLLTVASLVNVHKGMGIRHQISHSSARICVKIEVARE